MSELLIVIGIIVLLVTLAVPAFNAITGGRSIDAAENNVSAVLVRAREDAVALQEPRGAIFFPDPETGRVTVAEVYFYDRTNSNLAISQAIDLLTDRDTLSLPIGVGCRVLTDGGGSLPIGVILFDGLGRVSVQPYNLNGPRLTTDASGTGPFRRLPKPMPEGMSETAVGVSQVGFVLFDQPAFDQVFPPNGSWNTGALRDWMRDNTTAFLVNRYNGTVLRAGE
jgi:hypothetical protein